MYTSIIKKNGLSKLFFLLILKAFLFSFLGITGATATSKSKDYHIKLQRRINNTINLLTEKALTSKKQKIEIKPVEINTILQEAHDTIESITKLKNLNNTLIKKFANPRKELENKEAKIRDKETKIQEKGKKLKNALKEVEKFKKQIQEKDDALKQVEEKFKKQIQEKDDALKQVGKLKELIKNQKQKQLQLEIDLKVMKKNHQDSDEVVNKPRDKQASYQNQIAQYKKQRTILVASWLLSLFFSHMIANIKSIQKCIKRKIKRK
ncbi:MAG: hypothetical protein AAF770_02665 [Bacteroidota bacterium]